MLESEEQGNLDVKSTEFGATFSAYEPPGLAPDQRGQVAGNSGGTQPQ